jgi:hypothetical protein
MALGLAAPPPERVPVESLSEEALIAQAANTVLNVDLPWNPAVLEQRIARAHRMGQKQRKMNP